LTEEDKSLVQYVYIRHKENSLIGALNSGLERMIAAQEALIGGSNQ
jgi:hypothetical protein